MKGGGRRVRRRKERRGKREGKVVSSGNKVR